MTTSTDDGLKVLDSIQLRLLRAIDAVFLRLAQGGTPPNTGTRS